MIEAAGRTDIFIYPGYEFKVSAVITNFIPEST
jgi:S-adenosylmethionine:tRNA-ribosyltransferase-isomerase (queuine synthetase)